MNFILHMRNLALRKSKDFAERCTLSPRPGLKSMSGRQQNQDFSTAPQVFWARSCPFSEEFCKFISNLDGKVDQKIMWGKLSLLQFSSVDVLVF